MWIICFALLLLSRCVDVSFLSLVPGEDSFFSLMNQFLYLFLQKNLADVTSHLSSLNLVIFLAWDILQYLPGSFSLPSLINSPKLLSNWTKQSRNFGRLWEESTNCTPHIHIHGAFNAWFRAGHSIFLINYVVSEFRTAILKIKPQHL